jgi:hypothetical protein
MTTAPTSTHVWTEQDVKAALWRHYASAGWAVLTEVSISDGSETYARDRRIDVLCVRKAKRRGLGPIELLAIEVKVTRSDFLSDVKRPEKQAPWRALAHRHAYAVPAGLVSPEEVPAGSFLITVDDGIAGWDKVRAPRTSVEVKVPTIPSRLLMALLFRLSTAEANAKGLNPHVGQHGDEAEMRAKIQRLTQERDAAQTARRRAEDVSRAWRTYAKGLTGAPCRTCGHEVRAAKQDRYGLDGFGWRHVDKAHEEPCRAARAEELRQQLMAVAIRDHEDYPDLYPPVNPDTWQPSHARDYGPAPAYNPDEEPPVD